MLGKSRIFAIGLVGFAAFGAASAATEFAWLARASETDQQLTQVGEIYLDGLVASLRVSIEREAPGDVDRRLRSAMNEQNGIAERAIVVFDDKEEIKNRAGLRELFSDPRMKLKPGSIEIDRSASTMFVARRIGNGDVRVAVALNIEPLLKIYSNTRAYAVFGNLLAGLFAAGVAAWALTRKDEEEAALTRAASKPRLVA